MSSSAMMASSEAVIAPTTNAAADEKSILTSCQPSVAAPPSAPSVSLAPPPLRIDATSSEEAEGVPRRVDLSSSVAASFDASDNGSNANVSGIASKIVVDTHHNATTAPPPLSSTTSSVRQRSRRSTTNYHQDYSHDGLSITELEDDEIIQLQHDGDEDASSNHSSDSEQLNTQSSTNTNPNEEEPIALSMKNPRYKSIMHSFFRQLGSKRADEDDEERVCEEAVMLFQKYGGGVLLNYINFRMPHLGTKVIDEKSARAKILRDIKCRQESFSQWSTPTSDEEEEEEPVTVILSLKDDYYRHVMFTAFQKLGLRVKRDHKQENAVKDETFNLLKRVGKGTFFSLASRSMEGGYIEVDEKKARLKISNDISRRLENKSRWYGVDLAKDRMTLSNSSKSVANRSELKMARSESKSRRGSGSKAKKQTVKKVTVKKKAHFGATVKSSGRSSIKPVSIRKSDTKYSPPTTMRVSPYPKRSKAKVVTFKEGVFRADACTVAGGGVEEADSTRGYRCSVCGLPKKGHKCKGYLAVDKSSNVVAETPSRVRSQPSRFITPTVSTSVGRRKSKRKKTNCLKCDNCIREDCGICAPCRDKPKFGGRGTKRQRCLERQCLTNNSGLSTDVPFTSPSTTTPVVQVSQANVTLENVTVKDNDDTENTIPPVLHSISNDSFESPSNGTKFESVEEEIPSFEEITMSEFDDLVDLLQSSPLPRTKESNGIEVDWQGLHLANLSPIPILPVTKVVKLDTTKPIILGPNSAWSQRLIMSEEIATVRSKELPKPKTRSFNPKVLKPDSQTSDSQQFESILSPPNLRDTGYVSIFPDAEDEKLFPYSPIKPFRQRSSK